jgi:hypothetical protein
MMIQQVLSATLLLLTTIGLAAAADPPRQDLKMLDLKAKSVERLETSASLIGFTSTQVFYTLKDQRIVVVIHLDNTKKAFPVTGKVCRFAKDVTPEGMAKWLNNQHSDALFADAPEPEATDKLPAEACRVVSSTVRGQKQVNDVTYDQHAVEFRWNDIELNGRYRLTEFKDTVNVYVMAK